MVAALALFYYTLGSGIRVFMACFTRSLHLYMRGYLLFPVTLQNSVAPLYKGVPPPPRSLLCSFAA